LNFIICERYYQEEEVLYIGTTKEEDEYILAYIKRRFKDYPYDYKHSHEYFNKLDEALQWRSNFMYHRRFLRNTKEGLCMYVNENTNEICDMTGWRENAKDLD
jgi:hypothetical protein